MQNGFMNKIIGLVLVLVIGASLVGGLLIPTVQAVTATETTFENKGYYTMDKVAADANFTLEWDYTEPTVISIDGEKINLDGRGLENNKNYTIFGADNFVLRYRNTASPSIQYFGDASITPSFLQATVNTASTLTVTVAEGSITFTSTDPTYTTPATIPLKDTTYCINPKDTGAYIMKKSTDGVYIETNTDIIVLDGISTLYSNDVGIYAEGTINGDLTATTFRGNATYDVTYSNWQYSTTPVSGHNNLVKLENVTFTGTQNETDYTILYNYFIVPAEITAEKTQQMDAAQIAIFGVVGLLGIVLLVTIAAGAVRSKY